jgi:hypothetical protein
VAMLDPSVLENLRSLFEMELKRIAEKKKFIKDNSPARVDELIDSYDAEIQIWRKRIEVYLHDLLRYPPYHFHLKDKIEEFHQVSEYDKTVFIMTKFPEGQTQTDQELGQVISAVEQAITQCGFKPRLASQKAYYPELFKNVELYLLGASRRVAIVEDMYKPELNPNVALEWGWMRGMGKPVLYLQEKNFKA